MLRWFCWRQISTRIGDTLAVFVGDLGKLVEVDGDDARVFAVVHQRANRPGLLKSFCMEAFWILAPCPEPVVEPHTCWR